MKWLKKLFCKLFGCKCGCQEGKECTCTDEKCNCDEKCTCGCHEDKKQCDCEK